METTRRGFFTTLAAGAAYAGAAKARFLEPEEGPAFEKTTHTLRSEIRVTPEVRELAKTNDAVAELMEGDVAAAVRAALDQDAGITPRDRFLAGKAGMKVRDWVERKRKAYTQVFGRYEATVHPRDREALEAFGAVPP